MKLASLPSWGYDRRALRAEELVRTRAAAVSGRKKQRDRSDRFRKWLRGDFGPLVGVRP